MTRPVRLQLSRKKDFNLQALSRATNGLEAVRVSRPGKWGNPFVAHDWQASFRAVAIGFRGDRQGRHEAAVYLYRLFLTEDGKPMSRDERDAFEREVMTVRPHMRAEDLRAALGELRGKNLACWCKPDEPCHADVLLELANRDPGDGRPGRVPSEGEVRRRYENWGR
jgi:hypothetical protein